MFERKKGIILEQLKEPMFSKEIVRLSSCDSCIKKIDIPAMKTFNYLAPHEIIIYAREAEITDESDGKKLWIKLKEGIQLGVQGIVIDALDDEPYISSQLALTVWVPSQLSEGIALLSRAVGLANTKSSVIEIYKNIFDTETKIASHIGPYRVKRVRGTYPAEIATKRKNDEENILRIGAGAALALRNAVYLGVGHSTCFITLAGDCIANPANYEVPIGSTISHILESAGMIAPPKRIICGGSMTGVSIDDPDRYLAAPDTRGVLAFSDEFREYGFVCIACGRCTTVCPEGLSPYHIYKLIEHKQFDLLGRYDLELCNGCGACSYICPAKLNLSQVIFEQTLTKIAEGEPNGASKGLSTAYTQ